MTALPIGVSIDVAICAFSYADLDVQMANKVRATAARIRGRLRDSVIETGRDLIAVKEMLLQRSAINQTRSTGAAKT